MIAPTQAMELWAFLENSDFQRRKRGGIYRQDEVKLIRHDEFLDIDHGLMASIGCVGVRDAARWYVTHPKPHRFDWSWLDRVVKSAETHHLKLYLDLWHYGYPDWLDIMADDAPAHFAEFAGEIARRYPQLTHYCVSNEPSLFIDFGGRRGRWKPFLRLDEAALQLHHQVCRMIIQASEAILAVNPKVLLIIPEPWHAFQENPEERQASVIDSVLGRRYPELGGRSELISIIGLNHYRDSTIPPFHRLVMRACERRADKPIWFTETSGPPQGWKQSEWFWWMMSEVQLAAVHGARMDVFTWAPAISMYDWVDETKHLPNGIWRIGADGQREPDDLMIKSIQLAREYGYLK